MLWTTVGVLAGASVAGAASVTVVAKYPNVHLAGSTLYIRGEGCGWSWTAGVPMEQTDADTHMFIAECSESSAEFKIVADDSMWMVGANAKLDAIQEKHGTELLTPAFVVYPWFMTHKGSVEVIYDVASPQGLRTRNVAIYLPPSYAENTLKPYSHVLVAHDGQNVFDGNTCRECCSFGCWGLDTVLDGLISASAPGLLEEVVVVAPYNTAGRMEEYTYSRDPDYGGGRLDDYLDFLGDTLLPAIAERYPRVVGAQAAPWAMLGSSLGGLASCYAAWTRGSAWSPSICMSSSFWWNSEDFFSTVLEGAPPGAPSAHPLYIDWGAAESSDQTTSNERVLERLHALGWDNATLRSYVQPGAIHNEAYWGSRVDRPLRWLFAPAETAPAAMPRTPSDVAV